jgi:hypothetical protein
MHEDYLDGKLPTLTHESLIGMAKSKFNYLRNKGTWGAKSIDDDKIVAMTAAINELKGQLKLSPQLAAMAGAARPSIRKRQSTIRRISGSPFRFGSKHCHHNFRLSRHDIGARQPGIQSERRHLRNAFGSRDKPAIRNLVNIVGDDSPAASRRRISSKAATFGSTSRSVSLVWRW